MKYNKPQESHISSCYSADGFKVGGMNGGNASNALTMSKKRPILSEDTVDKSSTIAQVIFRFSGHSKLLANNIARFLVIYNVVFQTLKTPSIP